MVRDFTTKERPLLGILQYPMGSKTALVMWESFLHVMGVANVNSDHYKSCNNLCTALLCVKL